MYTSLSNTGIPSTEKQELSVISWRLLPATQTQHQVQSRLLLDVVVSQGAAILQLLASKNQPLLVRRDAYKRHSIVRNKQNTGLSGLQKI